MYCSVVDTNIIDQAGEESSFGKVIAGADTDILILLRLSLDIKYWQL
jgi:hypothetical protein